MHRNLGLAATMCAFLLAGILCGPSARSAGAQTDTPPSTKQSKEQGNTCGRFGRKGQYEYKWFRSAVHATFNKARIVNRRYCEGLKP